MVDPSIIGATKLKKEHDLDWLILLCISVSYDWKSWCYTVFKLPMQYDGKAFSIKAYEMRKKYYLVSIYTYVTDNIGSSMITDNVGSILVILKWL